VNLSDGKVAWEVEQTVVAQPAVGDRLLFVADEDALVALEIATGTEIWSVPLEAPLSAPLVWNMTWLIATLDDGTVLALRGDDGGEVWRRILDAGIEVAPALAGDRMYVSLTDGGLVALSLVSGEPLWEQQLEGAPQQVLPLDDLFVGAADNNFYRLSRVDGTEQWRWPTGGNIVGTAAVDEQRVFFSSLDNFVWALDRASGVQRWREPLAARPTAGPSYVNDLLVFGGLGQQITFYDPSDGTSYGSVQAPRDLAFPPMHLPGGLGEPTLVVVTGDGRLQALGPATVPRLLSPALTSIFGTRPTKPASAGDEAADETADGADPVTPDAAAAVIAALTPVPPLAGDDGGVPAPGVASATTSASGPPGLDPGAAAGQPVALTGDQAADRTEVAVGVAPAPVPPPTPASGDDGRRQALDLASPPPSLDPPAAPVQDDVPAETALVGDEPAPDAVPGRPVPPPILVPPPIQEPALTPVAEGVEAAPPIRASVGGEYAVQVGAFDSEESGTTLAERLTDAGFPAYVVVTQSGDRPMYRVRIGDFPDRASAEGAGQRAEDDFELDWFIVALP
jgi:cell division septation protein DedD